MDGGAALPCDANGAREIKIRARASNFLTKVLFATVRRRKGQENRAPLSEAGQFSGKQRLLTRGSGELPAKSRAPDRLPPPNVSGVSRVGDRRMNFDAAKPDRHRVVAFKNWSGFARLRFAMKMIVDVGT
jgi:hypothetical protein